MKTVIVGMSGGVDSSVSALLLQLQGFKVIGLFMKNWEETDENGVCQAAREQKDAEAVCHQLKIPLYAVNFVDEYRTTVFNEFLAACRAGLTPNPDVLCNREIKFKAFLAKAKELGADLLATGHYCRTDSSGRLLKGLDPAKDQSYFLHAVASGALQSVTFPVGALTKTEVRQLARKHRLSTSEKKDSTGICFIGKRDFKPFLSRYVGFQPGPLKTLEGTIVGQHDGVAFYTIGQRRGMGLGGEGEAWFVVGKEASSNTVYVARGVDHPALYASALEADALTWVTQPPPFFPFRCTAKIRYRQEDQACVIESLTQGRALVRFDKAQRAITPGQAVVFYDSDICLGGGTIRAAVRS